MTEGLIRLRREVGLDSTSSAEVIATVPETGQILLLNESAAFIVTGLRDGRTREELIASFQERFDLNPDRAEADVDRALFDLAAEGLVEHDRL